MVLGELFDNIIVRVIRIENVFVQLLRVVSMICFEEFNLLELIFLEVESSVQIIIVKMKHIFERLELHIELSCPFDES